MYIHERKEWPTFYWDQVKIAELLGKVRYLQGSVLGRMEALGFKIREDANLQILTQDILKTSEIEGEKLDINQVRSSLAKRLGINIDATVAVDRDVEGIVEVMLDATQNYAKKITKNRLFTWHTALFPKEVANMHRMTVGAWRTSASGPMQVVSGPYGREKVHFEAPIASRLSKEMNQFLRWFNSSAQTDLVIKSAMAHFWFVTIHPFDDGNGRIARAIADMVLAQSEHSQQRFYSMSAQILRERKAYYDVLEICQKSSLDITRWIEWFLQCMQNALLSSQKMLERVLIKARFWREYAEEPFNERQRVIINRLLDEFKGKLNSSKWAKITKCSQDTALRDINDLLQRHILFKDDAGGRSTSYQLNLSKFSKP